MKYQNIWTQFFRFLKQNDAYTEYRTVGSKECLLDKINQWISSRIKLGRQITIGELIDNSFYWSGTPQGHDFWDNLYTKGHSIYVKTKNNE